MKKKFRSIVVDNRNYSWSVVEKDWPNGTLRVWLDSDKNKLLLEVDVLVVEPIKPSHIAGFIRKSIE